MSSCFMMLFLVLWINWPFTMLRFLGFWHFRFQWNLVVWKTWSKWNVIEQNLYFTFKLLKEGNRDLIQSVGALKASDLLMNFLFYFSIIFFTLNILWIFDIGWLSDILFVHVKRCVHMSFYMCVLSSAVSAVCAVSIDPGLSSALTGFCP